MNWQEKLPYHGLRQFVAIVPDGLLRVRPTSQFTTCWRETSRPAAVSSSASLSCVHSFPRSSLACAILSPLTFILRGIIFRFYVGAARPLTECALCAIICT